MSGILDISHDLMRTVCVYILVSFTLVEVGLLWQAAGMGGLGLTGERGSCPRKEEVKEGREDICVWPYNLAMGSSASGDSMGYPFPPFASKHPFGSADVAGACSAPCGPDTCCSSPAGYDLKRTGACKILSQFSYPIQ